MLTLLYAPRLVGFRRLCCQSSGRQARIELPPESRGPPVFVSECARMCARRWLLIGAVFVSLYFDFGVVFHVPCYFLLLFVTLTCCFFTGRELIVDCFFIYYFLIARINVDLDCFLIYTIALLYVALPKILPLSDLLYFLFIFFAQIIKFSSVLWYRKTNFFLNDCICLTKYSFLLCL